MQVNIQPAGGGLDRKTILGSPDPFIIKESIFWGFPSVSSCKSCRAKMQESVSGQLLFESVSITCRIQN